MSADYATVEQFNEFGHEPERLPPGNASHLITAASRLFDKMVGVPDGFFAEAEGMYTSRTFYGSGTSFLRIDPVAPFDPADPHSALDPVNPIVEVNSGIVYGREGFSLSMDSTFLIARRAFWGSPDLTPWSARYPVWPVNQPFTVNANWGFWEVPEDVTIAVLHLAYTQWRTADPAFAAISNINGDILGQRTIPSVAQRTIDANIDRYRPIVFA